MRKAQMHPHTMSGAQWLSWFKGKPKQIEIRDTLFGDLPLAQWVEAPANTLALQPWSSFERARQSMDSGDAEGAITVLQNILRMPNLESRHYLQAHNQLRQLGVDAPSEIAKEVLGVVVEVGMDKGLDLVAAYSDHHARYFNDSGAAVIWERANEQLDTAN
jgi:hypothetical protein